MSVVAAMTATVAGTVIPMLSAAAPLDAEAADAAASDSAAVAPLQF